LAQSSENTHSNKDLTRFRTLLDEARTDLQKLNVSVDNLQRRDAGRQSPSEPYELSKENAPIRDNAPAEERLLPDPTSTGGPSTVPVSDPTSTAASSTVPSITSTSAMAQSNKRVDQNEQGTIEAWKALNEKRLKDAVAWADRVIVEFKDEAERMQKDLEFRHVVCPPVGRVSKDQKIIILNRGVLNDVATCYFIKGQALEKLKDKAAAKEAYESACLLTYARTWDPEGWFWNPAEKSCELGGRHPKLDQPCDSGQ